MSNRKKFSEEEIKNVGLRIKACRVLTGLTQEELGNKYGIPTPSIKTWEFGGVVPRLEGLKKFSDALRNDGVFVNTDWILYGNGTGPSYSLDKTIDEANDLVDPLFDDIGIFKNMFKQFCKKTKKNPVIFEINDEEMDPLYCKHDLIAGYLLSKEHYDAHFSKPVIVKLPDNNYALRYLHKVGEDEFFVSSLKNKQINKIEISFLGCVIWHKSN